MAKAKSKLDELLESLTPQERAELEAEWDKWDQQIEVDTEAGRLGKLDALAEKALRDHESGLSKPL